MSKPHTVEYVKEKIYYEEACKARTDAELKYFGYIKK